MDAWVYINDQIIPAGDAVISPLDLSVLRGYGVMDYLRTYGGEPFHLHDHLVRFQKSAEEIGLSVPQSIEAMTQIVREIIRHCGYEETSIKVVLTGGTSPDQYLPVGEPTFFAIAYPFVPFPKKYFEEGIKVVTECYARPFPTAKSIHYLPAIVAMQKAQKVGAVDVLFHDEKGGVLETGTANFFGVKEGKILTPGSRILKGITRQVVLEVAKELFPVEEREVSFDELFTLDGAFLTSSNKEVMPVSQINDHSLLIPNEVRMVMHAFSKKLLQNI